MFHYPGHQPIGQQCKLIIQYWVLLLTSSGKVEGISRGHTSPASLWHCGENGPTFQEAFPTPLLGQLSPFPYILTASVLPFFCHNVYHDKLELSIFLIYLLYWMTLATFTDHETSESRDWLWFLYIQTVQWTLVENNEWINALWYSLIAT